MVMQMRADNVSQAGGDGWKYPFYQKIYRGTLKNPLEGNDNAHSGTIEN